MKDGEYVFTNVSLMAKPPETDRRDWLWTIITTKKHKIMTRNNITTPTNTRIYGLRSFTNP
jgi:hypothetical protein